MAGDKNKHAVWALPLFLRASIITFLQNYDSNALVVTLNEMACFVPSTRILLVKAVYMELGSSHLLAKKIQPLGTSTTHCMQTEYRKHMAKEEDPSTRNILESGSSQRHMFSVFGLHAESCTRIFLAETQEYPSTRNILALCKLLSRGRFQYQGQTTQKWRWFVQWVIFNL